MLLHVKLVTSIGTPSQLCCSVTADFKPIKRKIYDSKIAASLVPRVLSLLEPRERTLGTRLNRSLLIYDNVDMPLTSIGTPSWLCCWSTADTKPIEKRIYDQSRIALCLRSSRVTRVRQNYKFAFAKCLAPCFARNNVYLRLLRYYPSLIGTNTSIVLV